LTESSAKTPPGDEESDDTLVESTEMDANESESEDSFLRAVAGVADVPPPDAEPERIGTTLGKYRVVELVGKGGMGIVYAAEDTKLRRRVALKVLPARFASDPERRQRFLREARAASSVTHRNIATVFDVDEASDGSVYLAMELVHGVTLRSRLRDGALAVPEAVRVAKEILLGLAKAHEVGIIHRDLKPDNVMLAPEGTVKLLDFGLAKPTETVSGAASDETTSSDVATIEGRVLGTPSYMSPEQAKGHHVDARSDIFSFGVLFYEMLSGERPFQADGTVALLIAIDRDAPKKLPNHVPRSLERLVLRCLAKRPEDRFASCDEILARLEADRPAGSRVSKVAIVLLLGALVVGGGVWANGFQPKRDVRPEGSSAPAPVTTIPSPSVAPSAQPSVEPPRPAVSAPPVRATVRRKPPRPPPAPSRDPLADQK
jgi:serine/threonine-protein kinase